MPARESCKSTEAAPTWYGGGSPAHAKDLTASEPSSGQPCLSPASTVSTRVNDWLAGPRGSVARRIRRSQLANSGDIAGLAAFLCGILEAARVPLLSFVPPLRPSSTFFMALASESKWVLGSQLEFLVVTPSRLLHPQQWLSAARVGRQLSVESAATAVAPRRLGAALGGGAPQLVVTQDQWLPLLRGDDRQQCHVVRLGGPGSNKPKSPAAADDCWIAVHSY